MKALYLSIPLLLLWGCVSPLASFQKSEQARDIVLEELRTDIADVKYSLHAREVEMRLLEEKVEAQGSLKASGLQEQIALLERKVASLEQSYERALADLKNLSGYAKETTASLSQYRSRIQEIEGIHQAAAQKKAASDAIYVVRSGDTLQKIAERHGISLDALKKHNNLKNDRIFAGQKLKIASSYE